MVANGRFMRRLLPAAMAQAGRLLLLLSAACTLLWPAAVSHGALRPAAPLHARPSLTGLSEAALGYAVPGFGSMHNVGLRQDGRHRPPPLWQKGVNAPGYGRALGGRPLGRTVRVGRSRRTYGKKAATGNRWHMPYFVRPFVRLNRF